MTSVRNDTADDFYQGITDILSTDTKLQNKCELKICHCKFLVKNTHNDNHTEGGFYKNFCECWSYLDTNPLKQNNILINGLIFFDHEVS